MKTGIELITEERQRQIEKEGWTLEHDLKHIDNSIAKAAACYAMPVKVRALRTSFKNDDSIEGWHFEYTTIPIQWPWEDKYWKPVPGNRIKELVKAGALIAAEIDRINNFQMILKLHGIVALQPQNSINDE